MIPLLAILLQIAPPAAPTMLTTAGTPAAVTLAWEYPDSGATFDIYRGDGECAGQPLVLIAAGIQAEVDDSGLPVPASTDHPGAYGAFCYTVTAVENGIESPQSAPITAYVAPPFPVTGVTVR